MKKQYKIVIDNHLHAASWFYMQSSKRIYFESNNISYSFRWPFADLVEKKKKNSQTVDSGLTIYADYTYFYSKKDFL